MDAAGRRRTMTQTGTAGAKTVTSHYDSTDDNPAWIAEADGSSTLYTAGLGGDMTASTHQSAGGNTTQWQLANLHGDILTTMAVGDTTPGAAQVSDEYGNPTTATTGPSDGESGRYGWLGSKQRSTEALGGLTLMGVRLYSPTLGRFLSVDLVVGGNENSYVYPDDPINSFDLDGRQRWPGGGAVTIPYQFSSNIRIISGYVARANVPRSGTTTAIRYRNTKYRVYEVYYGRGGKDTYKYGITRTQGDSRPGVGVRACKAAKKYRGCNFRWNSQRTGWFPARVREAQLINRYASKHSGRLPPGNQHGR